MKRLTLLMAFLLPMPVVAQVAVTLYPAVGRVPASGIQSLTSIVTGAANKGITWTTDGGTITGTAKTVAFSTATPGTYHITATSQTDGTKAATSTITVVATPTPRTDHPRLWVNADNLAQLRGWAVSGNPMWNTTFTSIDSFMQTYTNAHWTWSTSGACTGTPDTAWGTSKDTGRNATDSNDMVTEGVIQWWAFMSLIHPDSAQRPVYARKSCDMLMWVMHQAELGTASAPFRYQGFVTEDRMRQLGEAWALSVDWIQAAGLLTSGEKTTIQTVFKLWSKQLLNNICDNGVDVKIGWPYGGQPLPIGTMNSPTLLADAVHNRWVGNNYFAGYARNILLMSLALDAADDGGGSCDVNTVNTDGSAGCMRAYLKHALGAWMYTQYANYEDKNVASLGLGVSTSNPVLGQLSGGTPHEGFEYGASLGYMAQAVLAMETAGINIPGTYGQQVSLLTSSLWPLTIQNFYSSIERSPRTFSYQGQNVTAYGIAGYGGDDYGYAKSAYLTLLAPVGIRAASMGDTALAQATRWAVKNVIGDRGADVGSFPALISSPWGAFNFSHVILAYMLLDPTAATASDPRPSLPKEFIAPATGRVLASSGNWSNDSWFTFRCNWANIDHQTGDCGQFEFYRKGEWLVKAWVGQGAYGIDSRNQGSDVKNIISLQNNYVDETGTPYEQLPILGDQWILGLNGIDDAHAGNPSSSVSSGAGYIYAYSDATNMYNSRSGSLAATQNDIVFAQRSVLWLQPDVVVLYDRAKSNTANRFKRFNITTPQSVATAGTLATITSTGGQKLYSQSLLPAAMDITTESLAWGWQHGQAYAQPNSTRVQFQATGGPADTRFLHVLEAKNAGGTQSTTSLVQSVSGTNFDGAVVGTAAAMFKKTMADTFSTTTYSASGATTHYVSGLTPNHTYGVTATGAPGTATSDGAGVITFASVGTGNVTVTDRIQTVTCDLNGDGIINGADVAIAISQALGTVPCTNADLDQNGNCSVVDVQRVINASRGLGCRIGQ